MKKIKVLHITQATIGGTLEYLKLFFNNIDKDKYEVNLVCPNYGPMKSEIENIGVKVHVVDMSRDINVKDDLKSFIELKKIIKKLNPDIVHLHSSKAGVLGKLAAYLNKKPCIYNAHGWAFSMNVNNKKKKIYALIEKYTSIFCNKIVNISNYEYELAKKYKIANENKMVTIYNGIDINKFNNSKYEKEKVLEELNIPSNSFVVGMVARISEQKDPESFIRIAKKLCDQLENVYFVLVGDGELRPKIDSMIKTYRIEDKVKITGWVDDVNKYISIFDVGILTSKWEGFGLVLTEYMAASKPIVASNVGGIPELIVDKYNGFLVEKNKDDEFVKCILELNSNIELRTIYVQNSLKQLESKFNIKKLVEMHDEIYKELLGGV
ncbi:MAG: glycosyltransferase family 4 protein [Paraclostridium dentum]|uniref:glycosyltransferase family 4 protein n=1 Tax=Paraclostridium dentum TaxID=2662455 RepID=UPI003EE59D2D